MHFREYQLRVRTTDQNPHARWDEVEAAKEPQKHNVVPLLGLVGEVGGLLSEYKKMLRDGVVHEQFPELVAEELGDVLWYVATVATKFDLDLDKIAANNIIKTEDRWHEPGQKRKLYDDGIPENQRLPRQFSYKFSHRVDNGSERLVITDISTGKDHGAALRDNAYEDDGYRFHDVLHLAFAAYLGWSPVWRRLLRDAETIIKRTPSSVDDAEHRATGVLRHEPALRHGRSTDAVEDRIAWGYDEIPDFSVDSGANPVFINEDDVVMNGCTRDSLPDAENGIAAQ